MTTILILLGVTLLTAALIFALGWTAATWRAARQVEAAAAVPAAWAETTLLTAVPGPLGRSGCLQLVPRFDGAADPAYEAGYARDPFPTQTDPLRTEADIAEWLAIWRLRNRTMINRWKAGR